MVKYIENTQLPSIWKEAVKQLYPQGAYYTEYQNIKKNTLYIKVHDVIWINELEVNKKILLLKINKERAQKIQNIHFSL